MTESNYTPSYLAGLYVKIFLGLWLLINIFGVIFFILALRRVSLLWTLIIVNPIALISYVFMIFPAGNVFLTVRELIETKKWLEPKKFVRGIILQLVISTLVSLLTMIFFGPLNFTSNLILEFLMFFPTFNILFTVAFFTIYGLYSFFNE